MNDERGALMETILQSFKGSGEIETASPRWKETVGLIEHNIELHIYTICYWSCLNMEDSKDGWECAPAMRALLNRHRARFDFPLFDV